MVYTGYWLWYSSYHYVPLGLVVDRRWQNSDRRLLSSVPIHNCLLTEKNDRIARRHAVCVISAETGILKTKREGKVTFKRDLPKSCWKGMLWRYCGSCFVGYVSIFRHCVTFWDELLCLWCGSQMKTLNIYTCNNVHFYCFHLALSRISLIGLSLLLIRHVRDNPPYLRSRPVCG